MQIRKMLLFRKKHGVTRLELSRYSGISHQRLAEVDYNTGALSPHMNQLVDTAFLSLIGARRQNLADLEADFQKHRRNLLDIVDGGELL